MSPVHMRSYEFFCFSDDGLPSGEEQYFSMFGDRNSSVFLQSKGQFFFIFHRGSAGTMKVYKACLIFADDDSVPCPESMDLLGPVEQEAAERAVWVVEVKPVQAMRSIIRIATITITVIIIIVIIVTIAITIHDHHHNRNHRD